MLESTWKGQLMQKWARWRPQTGKHQQDHREVPDARGGMAHGDEMGKGGGEQGRGHTNHVKDIGLYFESLGVINGICIIKYHLSQFLRLCSIGRKYLSNFYHLKSWFKLSVSKEIEVLGV